MTWTSAVAQDLPDIPLGTKQIRVDIVATGLGSDIGGESQISPTDIVPDGTGRMFVATLGGIVRVMDGGGNLLPTPFLTQAQTNTTTSPFGEWGMTSIAFHPDFANVGTGGYGSFYTITTEPSSANGGLVDFSTAGDHQDVVKHWTMSNINDNVFNGTVREVMRVGQPDYAHNIFDLAFDSDAYLYISSGDGGFTNPANAQDLGSIHGKVLRVDPLDPALSDPARGTVSANGKYRVPTDNPFYNTAGALQEAWAYGLRSPFRMNFDRLTGDLWVGDVGENTREEIDLVTMGGNYGWDTREGTLGTQPPGGIDPVFEYDHDDGRSIAGGFVYRGNYIDGLDGFYIFADLGQGLPTARLFYGDPATGEEFEFLIDPNSDKFMGRLGEEAGTILPMPERIISIGEGTDGELYLATIGIDPRFGGWADGMIVRVLASLPGDLDGDGFVGISDLNIILSAWNMNVTEGDLSEGDPSGDGLVGIEDLNVVLSNWNAGSPPVVQSSATIPEPGTLAWLAVAGLVGMTRRVSA